MTEDALTDSLTAYYTDQLDPSRERALVGQVPSPRNPWMPMLLFATVVAVLLFAWVQSGPPPTPAGARAQWLITTELTLMALAGGAQASVDPLPRGELLELRTLSLESAAGDVLLSPTLTSASGQRATIESGSSEHDTIGLGFIATGEPGDWDLEVTLSLPEFDEVLTWSGHDDALHPQVALVALSEDSGWVVLADVVDVVAE